MEAYFYATFPPTQPEMYFCEYAVLRRATTCAFVRVEGGPGKLFQLELIMALDGLLQAVSSL
jgi:hypothetical protein